MGERKVRSDKKVRVNPPLDSQTHDMLKKLALACGQSKTNMAALLLTRALRDSETIHYFQDRYEADEYRIIPATAFDELIYVNGGRPRLADFRRRWQR